MTEVKYDSDFAYFECPYCGHEFSHNLNKMLWEDSESINIKCSNCNNEFLIKAYTTIEHKVIKKEDDF
ncbi:MAG: hypothetical protein NC222_06955 [Staphylococcus sp.]|nr:hypothetical protein [Staphylococcus sp.]